MKGYNKSEDSRGFSVNFLPILLIGILFWSLFSCSKNEPRVKTVVKYVYVDSSSVKTRTENKTEIVTEASKYKKKERKQDIRENNLEGDAISKETVNLAYTIKTDSLFQFDDDDYTEVEKTEEGYEIRVKDTLSIIKEVKYKKFLGLKIKKKYEKYHLVSHNPNIDYILSDIIIHNVN